MQKTFEEILREKMAVPVSIKGKDATVLPMEAMVLSVMNDAMRGNIAAILFIRSLTERNTGTDEDFIRQRQAILTQTIAELHRELQADGLEIGIDSAELQLIARQLLTLRTIAETMDTPTHRPVTVTPQKDGSDRAELSHTNRIFNDLYKAWRKDWQELRQQLVTRQMQRKIMKK